MSDAKQDIGRMSHDQQTQWLTDTIQNYIATHTPDESNRFMEDLNNKAEEILRKRLPQ